MSKKRIPRQDAHQNDRLFVKNPHQFMRAPAPLFVGPDTPPAIEASRLAPALPTYYGTLVIIWGEAGKLSTLLFWNEKRRRHQFPMVKDQSAEPVSPEEMQQRVQTEMETTCDLQLGDINFVDGRQLVSKGGAAYTFYCSLPGLECKKLIEGKEITSSRGHFLKMEIVKLEDLPRMLLLMRPHRGPFKSVIEEMSVDLGFFRYYSGLVKKLEKW